VFDKAVNIRIIPPGHYGLRFDYLSPHIQITRTLAKFSYPGLFMPSYLFCCTKQLVPRHSWASNPWLWSYIYWTWPYLWFTSQKHKEM